MLVGQDVTLVADDDAGAEVGLVAAALAALQLVAEYLAEDRILEQRMRLCAHLFRGVDRDHRCGRRLYRVGIGKGKAAGTLRHGLRGGQETDQLVLAAVAGPDHVNHRQRKSDQPELQQEGERFD